MMRSGNVRLVNIGSKATKKPSVDIVEVANRRATKLRTQKENNLLVELEVAGNVTSHLLNSRSATPMAQQLNTLQNGFIRLTISSACHE
jgi:hypothetical protein